MGGRLLEVLGELRQVRRLEQDRQLFADLLEACAVDYQFAHQVHQAVQPLNVDSHRLRSWLFRFAAIHGGGAGAAIAGEREVWPGRRILRRGSGGRGAADDWRSQLFKREVAKGCGDV